MSEIDEISYNYEEEGKLVRKELERSVLSKGAWATVMFLYQDMDRKTGEYQAPKIAIVRFKKSRGAYRKQSSFAISSEKQARQIIAQMEAWYAGSAAGAAKGEPAAGKDDSDEA